MKDEPQNEPPKLDRRAKESADHPFQTAASPATGKEKMVRRRLSAPIVIGVIAVVVVLALILL